ncbi:MAG: hypothetical protein AB1716_09445 [Planctomycetota bacterium]
MARRSPVRQSFRRRGPCGAFRTAALLGLLLPGCATTEPDRAIRIQRGYVYYLDGAGGGGALRNFSGGVRQGLKDAGYPGAGEMFNWETGLGLVADQEANLEYKRRKAAELARRIAEFRRDHPDTPIVLIGFSAGTVITVFALEALPADVSVETVVLLSGSLSADYDLTAALRRIEQRMYITTSHRDGMLLYMMPLTGTADRKSTAHGAIGVDGVRVPPGASPDVQRQYAKVLTLPWNEEFARLGDHGRHFDKVSPRFIQAIVAPLVMRGARSVASATAAELVVNPDYERWAGFAPGAWVRLRGYQVVQGRRTPLTLKVTLMERDEHRLVVEREFETEAGTPVSMPLSGRFVIAAKIAPHEHPTTAAPGARTELPAQAITAAGQTWQCSGYRVRATGHFPQWGTGVDATVYTHTAIPGQLVRVSLKTSLSGEPAEFAGELADYLAR